MSGAATPASAPAVRADFHIFRELRANPAELDAILRAASASPIFATLLRQLEATTTGDTRRDPRIVFRPGPASFFEPAENRVVLSETFRATTAALASLGVEEVTHALHLGPLNAAQNLLGDPTRVGAFRTRRLEIEAAGSLTSGAAAREMIAAAGPAGDAGYASPARRTSTAVFSRPSTTSATPSATSPPATTPSG